MRKNILMTAGLLAIATAASAQLDWTVLVPGSAALAIGTATAVEFDGVATTPDGTTQYMFDSEVNDDHLLKWDGSTLSIYATRDDLDNSGTANCSWNSQDMDANGVLYLLCSGTSFQEVLWRVPGPTFASAVSMVQTPDINEAVDLAVDLPNSRMIVGYNDINGVPGPAFGEGIGTVPLNATNGTITELVTAAELQTALSALPGYADAVSDEIDIFDLAVQSDGDIIVSHGFGSGRDINGSLLIVNSAGTTINTFCSANQLITFAGVDPSTVNIGNVRVETLSDDKILVQANFSSVNATLRPFFGVLSADGTSFIYLCNDTTVYADPDLTSLGATSFAMDGKHGGVDSNDNYYFYHQGTTDATNAVIKMTGIRAAINSAAVPDWTAFN